MGAAWFMGQERRIFTEFMDCPLRTVARSVIDEALHEIASGVRSFGRRDEWIAWFHYLLPEVIERAEEWHLLEMLIAACLNVDVASTFEGYVEFQDDISNTLGMAIMKPEFWCIDASAPADLQDIGYWEKGAECSAPLSASMYFCLALLDASQIDVWVRSIMNIGGPYWRANILAWLVGAHDAYAKNRHYFVIPESSYPRIAWFGDQLVNEQEFVSGAKVDAFFESIKAHLSLDILLDWTAEICAVEQIAQWFQISRVAEQVADHVL